MRRDFWHLRPSWVKIKAMVYKHRLLFFLLMVSGLSCLASQTRIRGKRSPHEFSDIAKDAAKRHGVDLTLVLGVIQVESSFRPNARSHVGARGLMQLMPKTAASLAEKLNWEDYEITDPEFNIEAGTYYLSYLLKLFDGDERLALAAYNTGQGRVLRWRKKGKKLPAYSLRYVAAVKKARSRFEAGYQPKEPKDNHDRDALRRLLRRELYGDRDDETLDLNRSLLKGG